MNIALEKTEEYVSGQLRRNYGDAFVRGNNGTFSTTASRRKDLQTLIPVQSCTSHQTHNSVIRHGDQGATPWMSRDSIA